MTKRHVDSCLACGKIGHLAMKVAVPGFVDSRDGSNWDYKCPLGQKGGRK